jgi:tRNA (guanine-N7-)-methyltransferase
MFPDQADNSAPPASQPAVAVSPAWLEDFRWERLFARPGPIELEIGTGKAAFLLRRAQALPQRNFLGIEWANEFYKFAVDRLQRWKIPNARMLRTDAAYFVRQICPRASLAALHVYHPDPWPKKRHHKRRLIQPLFVEAAVACLKPGARWAVQTDHAEYFTVIEPLLENHPQLERVPFDDPEFGVEAAKVHTNFEIKYRREGRDIFQIAVRKRG